jgi:pimeloyl-ACP methyl ester carboxylesterase
MVPELREGGLQMDWDDRFWHSADGLHLHYRDYPGFADRPLLLCIPGLSRNCRDFEALAAHLAGPWRVITPSLRGRGQSDYAQGPATYQPDTYVDDLLALLDGIGATKAILIGTSLGARLAMLLALRRRDLVAGAVLNDLGPETPADALATLRATIGAQESAWNNWAGAETYLAARHEATYPDFAAADWSIFARRTCRELSDGMVSLDYDPAVSASYAGATPIPVSVMWQGFDALKGRPLLSLRGSLSTMLSPQIQEEMRRRIPSIQLVTVANVGHAPTLDEPVSRAAIDRLLDAV